jgi:hypothetical protein
VSTVSKSEFFGGMLGVGREAEYIVAKKLETRGNSIVYVAPSEYFPDYDIIIKNRCNKELSFEIKLDNFNTPRLAVEFEQNGQPSGIKLTKADYYMFYRKPNGNRSEKFYYIKTDKLKAYIDNYSPKPVKCNLNSPTGNTSCYLIPICSFIDLDKRV